MTELARRIAALSPAKKAVLFASLKVKGAQDGGIIRPRPDRLSIPLSFAQRQMWFLQQNQPDNCCYNMPAAVEIHGALKLGGIKWALNTIVRRHDILRSAYPSQDGKPIQVIREELTIDLPVTDLSGFQPAERSSAVLSAATAEARRPFRIEEGPLIRADLLRLGPEEHVFLLTLHHIVADGWSAGVFLRELTTYYRQYVSGGPATVPSLPIQYADYASWQLGRVDELAQTQLPYWKERLERCPELIELPLDHPRPARCTYRGAHHVFPIPADIDMGVRVLSETLECTQFMTLLAALKVLLARYTEQSDLIVGTPVANRGQLELENLIGFFTNTLVIRTDLGHDPTFRELARDLRENAVQAYAHQDLPFEVLVEHLSPKRDASYNPLFQVMFLVESELLSSVDLEDLRWNLIPVETGTAKFDLMLTVVNGAAGMRGVFEYNTDLFDPSTIERMAGHYVRLLSEITANPDLRIGDIPLLSEAEVRQQVQEWNEAGSVSPDAGCLHELFERQVLRTPDALAVVCGRRELTYAELNRKANRLAHHLRSLGVDREDLVGVCVGRSPELIVSVLGVLKAGAAYVPLDPSYPVERIALMLEDSKAAVVVSEHHLFSRLPTGTFQVLEMESALEETDFLGDRDANPANAMRSDGLAYVIYTSGSTGRPKGVMIEHRSVVNLAVGLQQLIYGEHCGGPLRVSLNAPLSFDASVQQIVRLLSGDTIEIVPEDVRRDGRALARFLRDRRVDVFDCVPSQLKVLISEGLLDGCGAPRVVLPGGEPIEAPLWSVLSSATGTQFYNMYGPTECTVDSTTCCASRHPKSPSIGRPLPNVQAYILDRNLRPVPIGVAGELFLGGAGVGRGYLNRPDLTAEKFVPDPFSARTGGRLYRTGDRARYREDGHIEYLRRIDDQVKVRGHRIELGEIESVLGRHPKLGNVAVAVQENATGDKRLCAYASLKDPDESVTAAELREYLKQHLPGYMVPSSFVIVERLPQLPNGKLDRRNLPAIEEVNCGEEERLPTVTEELIAGIWSDVLGTSRPHGTDDFFEIGGHSLLATQVAARVRQVFDVELSVRQLFENPTLMELARIVESGRGVSQVLAKIRPRERTGEAPLSSAQQRLWFLDQLEPNNTAYNIAAGARLKGPLDVRALSRAIDEIVQRHEVLRTRFEQHDGVPVQKVVPELRIPLSTVDLRGLPADQQDCAIEVHCREVATRSFDLARGPLLRMELLQLSEVDHVLVAVMHHIISDGWSTGVLLRELAALYEAFAAGNNPALPEVGLQYADYALWQRESLSDRSLQEQLEYWKRQLAGGNELKLHADRSRSAVASTRGARLDFVVPDELRDEVGHFSRREGATPFMALFTAFSTLLHRYTGVSDILVGTPVANRRSAETEGLIGLFVNTLVLRVVVNSNATWRELLQQVRETALDAYAHQDAPFEMVVDAVHPDRDLSHSPLFQVMFGLQNAPMPALKFGKMALEPISVDTASTSLELTVLMTETKEGLTGSIQYNTDLFDEATIRRLQGHFLNLIREMVTSPEQTIGAADLLSAAERVQLVRERNETEVPLPEPLFAHLIIEQRARWAPTAIAVRFANQELTYAELEERANQLTHHLLSRGVKPDQVVGVCLKRSPDLLISLLAVLKSGAAYLTVTADS